MASVKQVTLYINNKPILKYHGKAPKLGWTVVYRGREYETYNIAEDSKTIQVSLTEKTT